MGIEILTDTQQRDVWLGFRIVRELNRILDAHNGQVSNLAAYEGIQPFDKRGMPGTDGTYGTYLAVYQLDTVIFGEDTRLCHPCEVSNGKLPAENLDNHTSSQYKRLITTWRHYRGIIPYEAVKPHHVVTDRWLLS
jgi:hypothetical protein